MSIVYFDKENRYVDLDYEEIPFIEDEIIDDFIDDNSFMDELYQQCNFEIEYDDYRKWWAIGDYPRANHFHQMLLDYANDDYPLVMSEEQKKSLLERWDERYDKIVENNEEYLYERKDDEYNE